MVAERLNCCQGDYRLIWWLFEWGARIRTSWLKLRT